MAKQYMLNASEALAIVDDEASCNHCDMRSADCEIVYSEDYEKYICESAYEWLKAHEYHERTCHDVGDDPNIFKCSSCGAELVNPYDCPSLWVNSFAYSPVHCPYCGKKVEDD